jgi:hypothetical protein
MVVIYWQVLPSEPWQEELPEVSRRLRVRPSKRCKELSSGLRFKAVSPVQELGLLQDSQVDVEA